MLCYAIWYLRADAGSEILIRSDTPEWDLRTVDFDGDHFMRARGSVAEYVPPGRVYALMTNSVDYADRIYING